MKKQWQILHPDQETVQALSEKIGCDPFFARLLVLRGMDNRERALDFLNPSFYALTAPLDMAGMERGIRRIHRALVKQEKILVFGDYDTDGITATAILVSFLKYCGARVSYYIPHRISDGYGLGKDFIKNRAIPAGIDLIITVDCGSSSQKAITYARQEGIDTIVTDHHPAIHFPTDAVAVINPKQHCCSSGLDHLAGVGVAFYLLIAMRAYLRTHRFWGEILEPNLKQYCDLVALGTIADVSPMIKENRVLTNAGLQQINKYARPGIAALMRMGMISNGPVDTETISFQLAPRLNAAGRLAHAKMACELLLSTDQDKANRIARALCRLNNKRKSMENELLETILARLPTTQEKQKRSVLVASGKHWHEGILGIVAARLTRQFNRPAVVISTRNGKGIGSGRSVEGIDLSVAFDQCADLLDRYGGHPLAAGLSLPSDQITKFIHRLTNVVDQMALSCNFEPKVPIDAKVPISNITPELMNALERIGPFGPGNPYPRFMDDAIVVHSCQRIGKRHWRMILSNRFDQGKKRSAIQFNSPNDQTENERIKAIVYRPQWNYWKRKKQLQLLVEETA